MIEDILEEDSIRLPGQTYALVSIVSPQSNQKHKHCGLKIRGCFQTHEEAEFHAKRLQKQDPNFDVYLVDMYKWLLIPPDNNEIENHQFTESMLQEIVQGHKEQQLLAKQYHQERLLENH